MKGSNMKILVRLVICVGSLLMIGAAGDINCQQEHIQTTFSEAIASGDMAHLADVLFRKVSTIISIIATDPE